MFFAYKISCIVEIIVLRMFKNKPAVRFKEAVVKNDLRNVIELFELIWGICEDDIERFGTGFDKSKNVCFYGLYLR